MHVAKANQGLLLPLAWWSASEQNLQVLRCVASQWASKENSFSEKFLVAVDKVIGGATALLELTGESVPHIEVGGLKP